MKVLSKSQWVRQFVGGSDTHYLDLRTLSSEPDAAVAFWSYSNWDRWQRIGPANILSLWKKSPRSPLFSGIDGQTVDPGIEGPIMPQRSPFIYRHLIVTGGGRNNFFSGVATGKESMLL